MRGWITPLTGGDGLEKAEGPYLWISWRLPTPRVEVRSVAIGCAGQTVCPNDEWGTVTFSGDEFDSRATLEFADTEVLIRTGELTKTEHVTNAQGTRWLEWTYRITEPRVSSGVVRYRKYPHREPSPAGLALTQKQWLVERYRSGAIHRAGCTWPDRPLERRDRRNPCRRRGRTGS